jgi:O-antigen/teichoic acid export membrane protein
MSASSSKKIISHGSIYLLGSILQRCVSFVMLPIYTRCLTPADYGTIELLSMVLDFVGIMLGLRVGQAIFRFYEKYDNIQDKNEVITTSMYLVALLNLSGIFLIVLSAKPLTYFVFGDYDNAFWLILFSFTLLGQGFMEIPMTFLRAQQKPWLYVTFSVLKLALQLGLNIYFVVVQDLHVAGVIYSALFSSAIMIIILGAYTFIHTGWRASVVKAKQLVSFSLPLVLTGMISFYITFGDRYFLRLLGSLAEVGVYSVGYKFGFLLTFIVAGPFNNIWDSEKYKINRKENAREEYRRIFLGYNLVLFLVVVGISVFVKDLLKIMSAPAFWPAANIVPIVLAAYVTNIWAGFTNLGVMLEQKTIEITYGTLMAAAVVTAAYLILIPHFGAMGAAWASLLAFGTRFVWVYWRSKRLYDMGLAWKRIGVLVLVGTAAISLSYRTPDDLLVSLCLNTAIFVISCLSLLAIPGIIPVEYRRRVMSIMKNPRYILNTKQHF